MSRHAGPPRASEAPPVPEPTFAERARTLLHLGRTGTLATASRKHPGHPFASIMPYVLDAGGHPLFLISTLAMHTQNLQADPRASLFVSEPGAMGEPLAAGRATVMGIAGLVPPGEVAEVRATYLAAHEMAAYWAGFGDFGFWRLDVLDVYWVGGFGRMGWVEARDYLAASPDPLAEVASGILEHMNRDHAGALPAYARFFAGAEADRASMVEVDRLGFKLRLARDDRRWSVRIPFPREVRTAADCRSVLVEMLRQARGARPA